MRNALSLLAVTLLVLPLAACDDGPTEPETRVFQIQGTVSGPYTVTPPPEGRCAGDASTPPITVISEEWTGTMTPGGSISMSANFCAGDPTTLPTEVGDGDFVIATSEGDSIRGTMSGWQSKPFDPNTGLAAIAFDLKVTGGSGMFQGASGLLSMPEFTGNGVESRLLPSDFEGTVVAEN